MKRGWLALAIAAVGLVGCNIRIPDFPPLPTPPPPTTLAPVPTPTPSPVATPSPAATPTPQPSASPTPVPTPTPAPTPSPCVPQAPVCSTTVQKVCVAVDGSTTPYTPDACWTWESYQGFMIRNGYYTAGDPLEDGDASAPKRPGHWLNFDAQQVLVELVRKSDGMRINPHNGAEKGTSINPPYMEKRPVTTCAPQVPCPGPTPTPGPSNPPPSPGPGCPVPSSCPNLISWGVGTVKNGVRNCAYMGANHVPTDGPVAGGFAVCDSTPRFGDNLPGKACNSDSHAVCSNACGNWRECEDPRGPSWSVSGQCHIANEDGFHVKVKLDAPGHCSVTANHPERPVDSLGQPVSVNAFVPGNFGFSIR